MTDLLTKRRAPILDGRLSAAMELAENCRLFADIGADHGRLSAVMLLQDSNRRALVADISAPALQKSRDLLFRVGVSSRAVFAVANGLDALDSLVGEWPDTVFILGMGGDTLSGILRRGASRLHGAALILGAQTDLPLVRQTLCETGYCIRREVVASDRERDYILLRAEAGAAAYTEEELLLGPVLLRQLPPNWLPVLRRRRALLQKGIQAMRAAGLEKDAARLALFEREAGYVQRALERLRKE